MSFITDESVLKHNLERWFNFDHLSPEQGIALLIGIEPVDESINALNNWYGDDRYIDDLEYIKSGIPLLNGDVIGGAENKKFMARHRNKLKGGGYDYNKIIVTYEKSRFHALVERYYQLLEYWESGKHPDSTHLRYFIEWTLSKKFLPEWLDSASEFGLYKLNQGKIAPAENAPPYSTKWLEVQQAAIAQFFNPRRNPDAKKEEVIEWIINHAGVGLVASKNIASTIFTIIKPENHDPKKKRIEPK